MKRMLAVVVILMLLAGMIGAAHAEEATIKCDFGSCTAVNGLTDEMLTQFTTKSGNWANTSLTLNNVSNEDLTRLPALKDVLETLVFWEKGSQVTDLAPIAKLPKLKKLQLRECDQLADLKPVAVLKGLEALDLYNLKSVTDLTPLGSLAGLKSLSLTNLGAPIDLAPLGKLANLQELRISQGVAYTSFDFLATLQNLERAYFLAEPANVIDISALSGKKKLQELTFSQAKIADIAPLKDATQLTKLALNESAVSDLSALAGLKKLKSLELAFLTSPNVDLTPVGALVDLVSLDVSSSTFADYAPLAQCARLESLRAQGKTNFAALDILAGLSSFKRLTLWENKSVQDWKPLAALTALESLQLGRTSFSDLTLVAEMKNLKELGFQECKVGGFETVVTLPALTNLNVTGAQGIIDISVLKSSPQLSKLYVSYKTGQFAQTQVDALKKAQEDARAKPAK